MRDAVHRTAVSLAIFAASALTACSGSGGSTLPEAIPQLAPRAARSVLVTVVNGQKRLAKIPAILYVCVDQPFCQRRDRVLKRGTTANNGQVTLRASFADSDFICVGAEWVRTGETRSATSCQNHFPSRIRLDFSKV